MKIGKMTDAMVAEEVARLNASEAVALARAEQRYKYRERQYLYTLRHLEKRGKELMAQGVTKAHFSAKEQAMAAEIGEEATA